MVPFPKLPLIPQAEITVKSPFRTAQSPEQGWPEEMLHKDSVRLSGRRGDVVFISGPKQIHAALTAPAHLLGRHNTFTRASQLGYSTNGIEAVEGDAWRSLRSAFAPLFRPSRAHEVYPLLTEVADIYLEQWNEQAATDISLNTARMGLHTAWALLFANSGETAAPPYLSGVAEQNMLDIRTGGLTTANHTMCKLAEACMNDRPEKGWQHRNPFILNAQHGVSNDALRNNAASLLFAGSETSARTLAFLIWVLGHKPDLQDQLRREVKTVCGHGALSHAQIPNLTQLDQMIKETQRLLPVASHVVKQAQQSCKIGGIEFAKGDTLAVCLYAMHRHRTYWDQADDFRPQRWQGCNHSDAFLPFGAGAHACTGRPVAELQLRAILAKALLKWRWTSEADTFDVRVAIVMHTKASLWIRATKNN